LNFFRRQELARSLSRRFIVMYVIALTVTVVAVSLGVWSCMALLQNGGEGFRDLIDGEPMQRHFVATFLAPLMTASLMALVIAVASVTRSRQVLRNWRALPRWFGGVRVRPNVVDPARRQLLNFVEEMAIASGIPVPIVHVLEHEASINAFACGHSTDQALIAVTEGCLAVLDRDELQAVVAHEFAHILNGDMRLNLRMMGPLFGLQFLIMFARLLLFGFEDHNGRRSKGLAIAYFLAVPLFVFGSFGLLVARVLKARTVRHREFLADACAVQFTRLTDGLFGALVKMDVASRSARLRAAHTEEVSHMLFGDGIGGWQALSMHPPIADRLQAVRPNYPQSDVVAVRRRLAGRERATTEPRKTTLQASRAPGPVDLAFAVVAAAAATSPAEKTSVSIGSASVRAGNVEPVDVARADAAVADLGITIAEAAHNPAAAPALMLTMLMTQSPGDVARQLEIVRARLGSETADAAAVRLPELGRLPREDHLALATVALQALEELDDGQRQAWIDCVEAMIAEDRRVTVFEYVLARRTRQVLERHQQLREHASFGTRSLKVALPQVTDLLAILAHHGHGSAEAARAAFVRGLYVALPASNARYAPPAHWSLILDSALTRLDELDLPSKELLVDAMLATMRHDREITLEERELLRVICACLHCPLPAGLGFEAR
jgi:Zn-dependent protease with chaperone function